LDIILLRVQNTYLFIYELLIVPGRLEGAIITIVDSCK